MTLREVLGPVFMVVLGREHEDIVHTSGVGIELELERSRGLHERDWEHWEIVPEPSLREDGNELIFRYPMQGDRVIAALDEIQEHMPEEVKCTPYCSTHIHLDFQNNTIQEARNFLSVFLLVESVLEEYSGENRKGNAFALSTRYADGLLGYIGDCFEQDSWQEVLGKIRMYGGMNQLKYSSINIASLTHKGTMEIRMMRGLKERDEIQKYLNIILSIRKYSEEIRDLRDLLIRFSSAGCQTFMEEVFRGHYKDVQHCVHREHVIQSIDKLQTLLIDGRYK